LNALRKEGFVKRFEEPRMNKGGKKGSFECSLYAKRTRGDRASEDGREKGHSKESDEDRERTLGELGELHRKTGGEKGVKKNRGGRGKELVKKKEAAANVQGESIQRWSQGNVRGNRIRDKEIRRKKKKGKKDIEES